MPGYISRLPRPDEALAYPRRLIILGATGSIGTQALEVAAAHPDKFTVSALAAGNNLARLAGLAARFRPARLAILDPGRIRELRAMLPAGYAPEIGAGDEAFCAMAASDPGAVVVAAIVGAAGLAPALAAAKAGALIALANKEALVLGGHLIRAACAASGAVILPVDSEHNAVFQALRGHETDDVDEIILTASGGPFRDKPADFLATVTKEQALAHPNWSMGAKISIDSATLMNKGLEVIEACHLYGLPVDQVSVLVHPQSIVHSLVRYRDGSILAHLGPPDMRLAIAYCLSYPERLRLDLPRLDIAALGRLTFERPRDGDFPCLGLARQAFASGGGAPVVLNAANEAAVALFLEDKIGFTDIPRLVETALERYPGGEAAGLETILDLDQRTRRQVTGG